MAGCISNGPAATIDRPPIDQTGSIIHCDAPGFSGMQPDIRTSDGVEVTLYQATHTVERGQTLTQIAECYYPGVPTETAIHAI